VHAWCDFFLPLPNLAHPLATTLMHRSKLDALKTPLYRPLNGAWLEDESARRLLPAPRTRLLLAVLGVGSVAWVIICSHVSVL